MSILRRGLFVREMEAELQRRGFVRAGNTPGICEFRRSSNWAHVGLGLRVEIRAGHEVKFVFPDGSWRSQAFEDSSAASKALSAAEIQAEFGR